MLTSIFLVLLFLFVALRWALFKKGIVSYEAEDDKSYSRKVLKVNSKYILGIMIAVLVILFQPFTFERIDSGAVGLKENLTGTDRGIQGVEFASGYQIYNSYTQDIHEIETDAKNVDYGESALTVKGGYPCPIHLTFNVKVKPKNANKFFVEVRQMFKQGGLTHVLDTWAKTSIMGSANHVANRYEPDYIFNNQQKFEAEIYAEVNKNLGEFLEVTQMKTNIRPSEDLAKIISDKIKTIQETQNAELNEVKALAVNKTKVANAQGDYDAAILTAKKNDILSQPKMLELYRAETERRWADKGISPWGENNVFGTIPGMLLQRK